MRLANWTGSNTLTRQGIVGQRAMWPLGREWYTTSKSVELNQTVYRDHLGRAVLYDASYFLGAPVDAVSGSHHQVCWAQEPVDLSDFKTAVNTTAVIFGPWRIVDFNDPYNHGDYEHFCILGIPCTIVLEGLKLPGYRYGLPGGDKFTGDVIAVRNDDEVDGGRCGDKVLIEANWSKSDEKFMFRHVQPPIYREASHHLDTEQTWSWGWPTRFTELPNGTLVLSKRKSYRLCWGYNPRPPLDPSIKGSGFGWKWVPCGNFTREKVTRTKPVTGETTAAPTVAPTSVPTGSPTLAPTPAPTPAPTMSPTVAPTVAPTSTPTGQPTPVPTILGAAS
jgi:hypothetical protein